MLSKLLTLVTSLSVCALEEQEPWAMYNIRALIDDNGEDEATRSDGFLNTIEERLTDMEPDSRPSQQQLEDAKQTAISCYQQVGYLPTSEFDDGKWWVKAWNKHGKAKAKGDRLILVYRHESKRNIQMKDYSFGLDSKCVDGKKLTALVLEPKKGVKGKDVTLKHSLVSVKCQNKSTS